MKVSEAKQIGYVISFSSFKDKSVGSVLDALLSGRKTVTRRDWDERTRNELKSALANNKPIFASDSYKDDGNIVGHLIINNCYMQRIEKITDDDVILEGFPTLTVEEFRIKFLTKYIKATKSFVPLPATTPVAVIEFKFIADSIEIGDVTYTHKYVHCREEFNSFKAATIAVNQVIKLVILIEVLGINKILIDSLIGEDAIFKLAANYQVNVQQLRYFINNVDRLNSISEVRCHPVIGYYRVLGSSDFYTTVQIENGQTYLISNSTFDWYFLGEPRTEAVSELVAV